MNIRQRESEALLLPGGVMACLLGWRSDRCLNPQLGGCWSWSHLMVLPKTQRWMEHLQPIKFLESSAIGANSPACRLLKVERFPCDQLKEFIPWRQRHSLARSKPP